MDFALQATSGIVGALQVALQDASSGMCGCIVILSVYAVAIIRTTNGYYSSDSHSWDKRLHVECQWKSSRNGAGKQLPGSCKFSSETFTITRFAPTSTQ